MCTKFSRLNLCRCVTFTTTNGSCSLCRLNRIQRCKERLICYRRCCRCSLDNDVLIPCNDETMSTQLHRVWVSACLINSLIIMMMGCKKSTPAAAPRPTDVEVVEVKQRSVPIYGQWIGTLDGFVNADVKAQVTGYLLRQEY